jgi:hypothetical protein
MIRRALTRILGPLLARMVRAIRVDDPWERIEVAPPLSRYGPGARLDFARYLDGDTTVPVASLEEIKEWLLGCSYESDETLFSEPDFWQHPITFERLRAGDCEDFSLWAWRKLVELGYDVDFVAGYCLTDDRLDGRHAWLVVRVDGVEHIFEAAARDREKMLLPLVDVRHLYVPQVGVDRNATRFAFQGFILAEQKKPGERSAMADGGMNT